VNSDARGERGLELDGGLRLRRPIAVEPLEVYDRRGDGHTVSRHCGTTPQVEAERLAQHPWLEATGSFPDVATAQRCVEACVVARRTEVERWRRGGRSRLAIGLDMRVVIGDELRRSAWQAGEPPQPVTALRVVLKRDRTYRSGFAVLTAYPVTAAAVAAYPRQP
jgi:Bacterial CdiA-CT RNAse A domain